MIQLTPDQLSPAIRAILNEADLPAGLRCQAVLAGQFPGEIYADNPVHPTWAVVRENIYGTLFPAGDIHRNILQTLVDNLRPKGDVLIGLWPNDPLLAVLPDTPQYEGRVIDCTNRPVGKGLDPLLQPIPEGCAVFPMNAELLKQSPWYEDRLKTYGSIDAVLEKEIGFGLVRDNRLVSEASAGPLGDGIMEMGTITHKDHRGKGYAAIVCAHTIRECETRGLQTYWNCNTDNLPSVALSRKLGYRSIREYRLFGWFPPA